MTNAQTFPFKLTTTLDGSCTLFNDRGEGMHSTSGAFLETQTVYGPAVVKCLESHLKNPDAWFLKFLSVGLGLGYVEMMVVAQCLALLKPEALSLLEILSFETDQNLKDAFMAWGKGENLKASLYPPELLKSYDEILGRTADFYSLPSTALKNALGQLLKNKRLILTGALRVDTNLETSYPAILYDAFSSITCPELWEEDFLVNFLNKAAAKNCIFATYSAKGSLKRALKKAGFTPISTLGFGAKREKTLAIKQEENLGG